MNSNSQTELILANILFDARNVIKRFWSTERLEKGPRDPNNLVTQR